MQKNILVDERRSCAINWFWSCRVIGEANLPNCFMAGSARNNGPWALPAENDRGRGWTISKQSDVYASQWVVSKWVMQHNRFLPAYHSLDIPNEGPFPKFIVFLRTTSRALIHRGERPMRHHPCHPSFHLICGRILETCLGARSREQTIAEQLVQSMSWSLAP